MVRLLFICFFFFFKQKTAYEIGWCDWSSYVCSSDLRRRLGGGYVRSGRRPARQCDLEVPGKVFAGGDLESLRPFQADLRRQPPRARQEDRRELVVRRDDPAAIGLYR